MKNKKLIIFGNSLMGEIAYYNFKKYSKYKEIFFCAEKKYIKKKQKKISLPLEKILLLKEFKKEYDYFIGIGYSKLNTVRQKFINFFLQKKFNLINFIHPQTTIDTKITGINNFIMDNVSINPYTKIGNGNILWSSVVVGHHNKIGSNNFFSGNVTISGNSIIKNNCFFGVNSCTKDGINIQNNCFIDAGEYVNKNLKKNSFFNTKINKNEKVQSTDFIDL